MSYRSMRATEFALLLTLVSPLSATLMGQTTDLKVKEEKAGLLKLAKVAAAPALASAQAKVPGGKLKSAEIEREDGKLVYSFSFTTGGKSGEDEVLVDAMSGVVLKTEHETPEQEAREEKAKTPTKRPAAKKPPGNEYDSAMNDSRADTRR